MASVGSIFAAIVLFILVVIAAVLQGYAAYNIGSVNFQGNTALQQQQSTLKNMMWAALAFSILAAILIFATIFGYAWTNGMVVAPGPNCPSSLTWMFWCNFIALIAIAISFARTLWVYISIGSFLNFNNIYNYLIWSLVLLGIVFVVLFIWAIFAVARPSMQMPAMRKPMESQPLVREMPEPTYVSRGMMSGQEGGQKPAACMPQQPEMVSSGACMPSSTSSVFRK